MPTNLREWYSTFKSIGAHGAVLEELSSLELSRFTGWAERVCSFEISDMSKQTFLELSWDDSPFLRSHLNHILKYLELHFRTTSELSCYFVARTSPGLSRAEEEYCDATELRINVIIF